MASLEVTGETIAVESQLATTSLVVNNPYSFWEVVIMYMIISIIWLCITVIIAIGYGTGFWGIIIFIILTFLYIPIIYYYMSRQQYERANQITLFTIVGLLVYLVVQALFALAYISEISQ